VNIHPALLSGKGAEQVTSSQGVVPEIRGVSAIEKSFAFPLEQMPVTGVTIHYIDPAKIFDTGEVILKQEVRRRAGETLEKLEKRVHETEHEMYGTALQKILLDQIS
jgi:phosphoribosylglycinamide formyltransferase-1